MPVSEPNLPPSYLVCTPSRKQTLTRNQPSPQPGCSVIFPTRPEIISKSSHLSGCTATPGEQNILTHTSLHGSLVPPPEEKVLVSGTPSPSSSTISTHNGNKHPGQDGSDSPDPPVGSPISLTSFSQTIDDESDPETADVKASNEPQMFFDIISLHKKPQAKFHPTKFIGNRNRKYPHYSVTATLQWENCAEGL